MTVTVSSGGRCPGGSLPNGPTFMLGAVDVWMLDLGGCHRIWRPRGQKPRGWRGEPLVQRVLTARDDSSAVRGAPFLMTVTLGINEMLGKPGPVRAASWRNSSRPAKVGRRRGRHRHLVRVEDQRTAPGLKSAHQGAHILRYSAAMQDVCATASAVGGEPGQEVDHRHRNTTDHALRQASTSAPPLQDRPALGGQAGSPACGPVPSPRGSRP